MAEADDERPGTDERAGEGGLNDKLLDAFVFVPAGLALSVVEELPRLAARGREHFGVRVSSARAVGQFAVKAGHDEFVRRSDGWFRRSRPGPPAASPASGTAGAARSAPASTGPMRSVPTAVPTAPKAGEQGTATPSAPANGHIPAVATLSIPGFDALSASQVVQRLDGLNRSELVSVRAYEASTRGRRTILSRVDQLLDERS